MLTNRLFIWLGLGNTYMAHSNWTVGGEFNKGTVCKGLSKVEKQHKEEGSPWLQWKWGMLLPKGWSGRGVLSPIRRAVWKGSWVWLVEGYSRLQWPISQEINIQCLPLICQCVLLVKSSQKPETKKPIEAIQVGKPFRVQSRLESGSRKTNRRHSPYSSFPSQPSLPFFFFLSSLSHIYLSSIYDVQGIGLGTERTW